jgi:3-methyladenine DNA glycosylase AlkD
MHFDRVAEQGWSRHVELTAPRQVPTHRRNGGVTQGRVTGVALRPPGHHAGRSVFVGWIPYVSDGRPAVAETTVAEETVAEVMAELAALEDPKVRAVNEKHGDDHGVNLSMLRALAKRLKTQQDLASRLWRTGDTAARLLAILICRPKAFARDELDVMVREARTPKVHDWLVNYLVKKSPHAEALRLAWSADPDPVVASAGWALTTERVARKPEGLDLDGLLDVIEAEMRDAPDRLQWAMNHCLAQIGIEHTEHRARAIDIGERLQVLKDYPTPPNCTSPFAPVWIAEMVRRQQQP